MLLSRRAPILDSLLQVPYLGQRLVDEKGKAGPYHWLSYAEVSKIRTEIGSGLLHYGMKSGSTMGLYSVNCRGMCMVSCLLASSLQLLQIPAMHAFPKLVPTRQAHTNAFCSADWMLVESAAVSYSLVTVPLYDTLGPDAVRYISNHAELSAVACSVALLPMLLQSLQGCPTIFLVVSGDSVFQSSRLLWSAGVRHDVVFSLVSPLVKCSQWCSCQGRSKAWVVHMSHSYVAWGKAEDSVVSWCPVVSLWCDIYHREPLAAQLML